MKLTTKDGINLNTYYRNNLQYGVNCRGNNKTRWLLITPYDLQEFLYYFCKHLGAPTLGVITFLIFLFTKAFHIPVSDLTIGVFLYTSILCFLSVVRENLRAIKYRIKNGQIVDNYEYENEEEELLFQICTNEISQTNVRIGFVGDIMKLNNFKLQFDIKVINFFKDVDLIVGNLEGIFHRSRWPRLSKQRHREPPILRDLRCLRRLKSEWLLSVSNNHSIDYGNINFCNTLRKIQKKARFNAFGHHLVPTILCEYRDLMTGSKKNDISISTVSEWCNQKKWGCICKYKMLKLNLSTV